MVHKCKECGGYVSSSETKCHNCGAEYQKAVGEQKLITSGKIAFIVGLISLSINILAGGPLELDILLSLLLIMGAIDIARRRNQEKKLIDSQFEKNEE